MTTRAVFLDRDGTIMEDTNYVGDVNRVILIPSALPALQKLQAAGFPLFIVTNQSGVGRGYFTRAAVDEIHAHLDEQFARVGVKFTRYFVCPHHPEDKCACRKPQPKFFFDAAQEYGVDLARSFMIGDRASDVQAGVNAGARSVLVLTGAGRETVENNDCHPAYVAADVLAAAEWIVQQP